MVMEEKKKISQMAPTRIILFGFLAAILIGTCLLTMPFSSASGEMTAPIDALFTATTSVCVTGLTTVTTADHWSVFGQFIILVLIQFGGLGVVTFSTAMMLLLGKKVSLKGRIMIQEAYSLNNLSGMVKLIRRILFGTFLVEGLGALFYMIQFIPEFGLLQGIWISVFNAVSAFCNAGMDIISTSSMAHYVENPIINLVTMTLIVSGGLGFTVWWDLIRVGKLRKNKEIAKGLMFQKLSLHSKVVLFTTVGLIGIGAFFIFLLEYSNRETLGSLSFGNKIMASFFQSVTTRTAGFFSLFQENLKESTCFLCIILMFIGGSPVGTAGGVKTVTAALLFATIVAVVKGERDVTIFNRKIPEYTIRKCLAVVSISLAWLIAATMLLSVSQNAPFLDCFYETTSALATVGLSRNLTPDLNTLSKLIIILTMYIGRVGPITMAVGFNLNKKKTLGQFPEEDILVG